MNDRTTIGVLSPVTGGFYYGRVLAGIDRELRSVGGRIVFIQTLDAGIASDDVVEAPDFRTPIAWDHLDGVISIATSTRRRYLQQLLDHDIPVVVASDVVEGLDLPAAVPDNAGGVSAAVGHLVAHGHSRIGFAANLVQSDMRERLEGFRSALITHDLEWRDEWFLDAPDNGELGGADVARRLLDRRLPITAMVFATDRNAIGCMEVLVERGVKVPDDLAVVGFDGIDAGAYSSPTLTTVSQRFDDIGAAAANLLLARIDGQSVANGPYPISGELLVRESCGCGGTDTLGTAERSDSAAAIDFWRSEAALHLERSQRRERWMREQYEIGIRLLDHDLSAPQHLEWLSATGVRAAELALWDGDPALGRVRIAGTYDGDGASSDPGATVGNTMSVTSFPTVDLLHRSDAHPGEATIVVPVAARGQDFGLLAVVGEVDALSANGRETHNQWAALLTVALDQQLLHDQLRKSEERYSLWAQATDDGLWDWDVASGQIYYSGRSMEMIGLDYRSVTGPPTIWLDRVHPDDRDRMHRAMSVSSTTERRTIELEHRIKGRDGHYRRVVVRALPVGPEGVPATRIVGSIHDVEVRRQLEEQLRRGALYDDVTGLPNRRMFLQRLDAAIARERDDGRGYVVAFVDLDGFKLVNDSLGHLAGDRLLAEIGARLERRLRRSDVAARFGGDEFALLLDDVSASAATATVADVLADIRRPVDFDGSSIVVSASTGITTSDFCYSTPDEVIRDADLAMYRAKATRADSPVVFDESLRADGRTLSRVWTSSD